jgi:hypothetical protein
MWSIWSSRNKWAHGEKGFDPFGSIQTVHDTLMELELPPKAVVDNGERPLCTWHGPTGDSIKINIDGAINGQDIVAGSGGVARDSSRRFRGAWCKAYPGIVDPLISEALALRDAVLFARARSFSHISVETDCSELVRLWENKRTDRSVIAPILEEVSILSLDLQVFSISFAGRSANKSAHECARYACLHNMSEEWSGASPVFLQNSLQADCNGATVI